MGKIISWIKENRIKLLIILLVATNLATAGYLVFFLRKEKENHGGLNSTFPLIDITRNFIPQEDFIVNIQPLREELRELVALEEPESISLYFEFLNTGANIAINQDLRIWPASLAKLPLALTVMKKVETGVWQLDNKLVLMEADRDSRSTGDLSSYSTGTKFTIEELLSGMLSRSDNTAYKILLRNMDEADFALIIEETGLEALFDEEGRISAKEYSRIFRTLYTSSFLKRENSSKILEWLSATDFDKFLASGLDKEVRFANKWGVNEIYHVFSDSGIVYVPNRPYLLTVIIRGDGSEEDEEKVQELMKDISSRVYRYVTTYKI